MKSRKTLDWLLNVAAPLLLGFAVYRGENHYLLPTLVRNYLPDCLWAYAFISTILIIWDRQPGLFWILAVYLVSAGFEILQYRHWVAGTGDIKDILAYFIIFCIALILNRSIKPIYTHSIIKTQSSSSQPQTF